MACIIASKVGQTINPLKAVVGNVEGGAIHVTAVLDSFPQTRGNGKKPEENPLAERQMRAFYCDIMHRPEKEFFESTYREIDGRTEDYLVAKGLKKPPAVIQLDD